ILRIGAYSLWMFTARKYYPIAVFAVCDNGLPMPTETRRKSSFTATICMVALLLLAVPLQGKAKQEADKILIVKSAHTMTLLSGGKLLKTYKVALGSVPVGPKRVEGD